jgi:hypothetical protein
MDKRYILGVSNFIADAKADVKDGNSVFSTHAKIGLIKGNGR